MLTTDMPEWLTVLLTEASAAVHGRGNLNALTAAIREVPEPYLEFAGLRWALSSFDDRAPTAEAINAARDQIGDPAPRLSLTPRSENPHELATAARWHLHVKDGGTVEHGHVDGDEEHDHASEKPEWWHDY